MPHDWQPQFTCQLINKSLIKIEVAGVVSHMPRTHDEISQSIDSGYAQRNISNDESQYHLAIAIFNSILEYPELQSEEFENKDYHLNRTYYGLASCYHSLAAQSFYPEEKLTNIKLAQDNLAKINKPSIPCYILTGLCFEQENKIPEAKAQVKLASVNLYKQKSQGKLTQDQFSTFKQKIIDFKARHPAIAPQTAVANLVPKRVPQAVVYQYDAGRLQNRFACLSIDEAEATTQKKPIKYSRK